jgi:putative hydrolase of the HAD superfamily
MSCWQSSEVPFALQNMADFPIRAVALDVVGTLLQPVPAAVDVYAQVGRRFGCRIEIDDLSRAFHDAFARQDAVDAAADWRTDEARELQRWRSIVGEVLVDASDPQACFAALYEHFAHAAHWQCDPAATELLAELNQRGCKLALASNFDGRLHRVIDGFPVLASVRHLIISSEVGWRKPSTRFFDAVCRALETPPYEVLHMGDDPRNDYQGAVAAGCQAVLFDPRGRANYEFGTISALNKIVGILE